MFEDVEEIVPDDEADKKLKFYYNREERIARAPKLVQDYYNGNELPLRTITAIEVVHEVSIVNKPAYKDTTVVARSEREHLDAIREQMESRNKAELELEKLKTLAVYGMV